MGEGGDGMLRAMPWEMDLLRWTEGERVQVAFAAFSKAGNLGSILPVRVLVCVWKSH